MDNMYTPSSNQQQQHQMGFNAQAPYPQAPLTPGFNQPQNQMGFNAQAPYPQAPLTPGFNQPQNQMGFSAQMPSSPASSAYSVVMDSHNALASKGFSDKSIRNRFIMKVYLILTAQLLVTFCIISIFQFASPVKLWIKKYWWSYYAGYGVFVVTYLGLLCFKDIRRQYPMNIILLSILTLAMSYMAGTITAFHDTDVVFMAIGMTAGLCLGITILAVWGPIDFTKWHFFLAVASLVFVIFSIMCTIIWLTLGHNRILYAVYCSLGLLLFSLFLAYDTQEIVGGRRYELSEEDYITGAMELYVDIVYIFIYILGLSDLDS